MKIKIVSFIILTASLVSGQEAARQIWDTGFLKKRPPSARTSQTGQNLQSNLHYRTTADPHQQTSEAEPVIGLTLWKLRSAAARDENIPRLLIQDSSTQSAPSQFVPERATIGEPLHEGDRIRLSIESPRAGFLYVIDRERYSDGTTGEPILVFPAGNFNEGTNDIGPGRLVEIPPQNSKIPALKVSKSGDRHIGEELLIIVAREPVSNLKIEARETKLSRELVAQWEREWSTDSLNLSLDNDGKATPWTQNEKDAGENRRLLTQDDPMPSMILSVRKVADTPLLLRVLLPLADPH